MRAFKVTPKRVSSRNGVTLTPDMSVTFTTLHSTSTPFYNGSQELKEAYLRIYGIDIHRAGFTGNDFTFEELDK